MFSDPKKNIESLHIEPGMKVADLGSGAGFYTLAASEKVEDEGMVFAIEVQKELVTKLQNEANKDGRNNVKAIWADFETAGGSTLTDNLVDRVLLTNTLFQADDKYGALQEAYRILKPRGKLLLVDWTDSHGGLGPHPNEVLTEEQARQLAEDVGFILEEDIDAGDHHYGMIFHVDKRMNS